MKFYKDNGIPLIKFGEVTMKMNAEIRVTRLSDGFVCHRQNKPIKKSEYWDKTKYLIEEWEWDREKNDFIYIPLKY
jgi:hypothetical protein